MQLGSKTSLKPVLFKSRFFFDIGQEVQTKAYDRLERNREFAAANRNLLLSKRNS